MRNPYRIPPVNGPLKIGLFGGSFNPPHQGHVQVSQLALRRLDLDQIWWIVTPGNPLKSHTQLLPIDERLLLCRKICTNPSFKVTGFEAGFNTRFTADTLKILLTHRPLAMFTWVMGADNLAGFHKWERWRDIITSVPIAVIDRPGASQSSFSSPAACQIERFRLKRNQAPCLPFRDAPAWTYIHGPRSYLSSSAIRSLK